MNDPQDTPRQDGLHIQGSVSHSQFAWSNEKVVQRQEDNRTVAPGYEALAERVNELIRQLPESGLGEQDRGDAQDAAEEVLAVITRADPDEEGRLRRALATLRGVLAPAATGIAAGATAGAQQWALEAIGGLTGI
ncbi:hypothetical protein OG462_15665 [Streptomyces sp. NBC_01077]|uniref:hypothetical protein n=1 Tax=Streptomyces sp. NBC_01077 TaxID=2903746 RepID=UPI00386ED553|nr:hypothetical protein OG462_15665 [Streptomyces sp. NBC_01077]